jgi:DNA polymerase-3 subunit delta'
MKNGKLKFDWPLVGNSHISDFLEKCLVNKSISGTYIFTGPDNLGKTTLAKNFAKILLCRERGQEAVLLPCGKCDSCRQFKD